MRKKRTLHTKNEKNKFYAQIIIRVHDKFLMRAKQTEQKISTTPQKKEMAKYYRKHTSRCALLPSFMPRSPQRLWAIVHVLLIRPTRTHHFGLCAITIEPKVMAHIDTNAPDSRHTYFGSHLLYGRTYTHVAHPPWHCRRARHDPTFRT